jgi:hypothetical protein
MASEAGKILPTRNTVTCSPALAVGMVFLPDATEVVEVTDG